MEKLYSNTLILGGARSGKSSYAEKLALESGKKAIYLATAKVLDKEMEQRVSRHKNDRPSAWKTVEESLQLSDALHKWSAPDRIILVDCLTMWLTNLLSDKDESLLKNEVGKLLATLPQLQGEVIFVSNEVGMGIIPMGELTRRFVDETGFLHQQLAQKVNTVILMVAGIPQVIKG